MKYVEIYKLQNNGFQTVAVTCRLQEDGTVLCEGDEKLIRTLTQRGVLNYTDKKNKTPLFPKDGFAFLKQLKYHFKSGYLNASDIQEI